MAWLSILIWLPLISSVLMVGVRNPKMVCCVTYFGLFITSLCFALSCYLWFHFDPNHWGMQFQEILPWIDRLGIQYALGVDGFSLPLIILTCFMGVIVFIASVKFEKNKVPYLSAFLLMQGLITGVFAALDAILFYMFWEAMLIPMFLIIGIWGGQNRIAATIKFFLYTFLGSVCLLVSVIYLYTQSHSFYIPDFYGLTLNAVAEKGLFWGLMVAFAIKIPMLPLHTWLPDAHVEAPTAGSVILAAILLKVGAYGLLRFVLPVTPQASLYYADLLIYLSLAAIIYIGFVALVQTDLKKLIAYASIAHMGFVTLGLFSLSASVMGIEGAMVQMISHGFVSGALFLCVGILYDRAQTKSIQDFSGVAVQMPHFAVLFMLFALANIGLPGTSGFVGEFLVIVAAFKVNVFYALLAGTTLILSAGYMLSMVRKVIFGQPSPRMNAALVPLLKQEKIVLYLLGAGVILFGLWPTPILKLTHASSAHLLAQVQRITP